MLARKMTELVPTLQSELNRATCDLCHTSKIKSFNGHPEDSLQQFSGLSNETSRYPLLANSCQIRSIIPVQLLATLIKKAEISSSAWKMTVVPCIAHLKEELIK